MGCGGAPCRPSINRKPGVEKRDARALLCTIHIFVWRYSGSGVLYLGAGRNIRIGVVNILCILGDHDGPAALCCVRLEARRWRYQVEWIGGKNGVGNVLRLQLQLEINVLNSRHGNDRRCTEVERFASMFLSPHRQYSPRWRAHQTVLPLGTVDNCKSARVVPTRNKTQLRRDN